MNSAIERFLGRSIAHRITMDAEKKARLRKENETNFFPSKYKFLNDHNGLRPANVHLIFSKTGVGKSTLLRSLMNDYADQFQILYYSTEERLKEVETMLAYSMEKDFTYPPVFISEKSNEILELVNHDDDIKNIDRVFDKLTQTLIETESKILIFDNITTSILYLQKSPAIQSTFARRILSLVEAINLPAIIFQHLANASNSKSFQNIEADDVKGAKDISSMTQYSYYLTQKEFYNEDDGDKIDLNRTTSKVNFLHVKKNRWGGSKGNNYVLNFCENTKIFDYDMLISNQDLNDLLKREVIFNEKKK